MRYLAGIDGGQSSTAAAIVGEDGTVVGRGTAGPCDDVGEHRHSTRLARNTATALEHARDAAGLDGVEFAAIVVGISGFAGTIHGIPPELPSPIVRFDHDAPIALAGALEGEPGIVLIAGSGSIAYGEDPQGGTARAGGWGYCFGDAGSGFALGRDALADAMAALDRGITTPLGDAALGFFDERDLQRIARGFYTGRITRPQIAAFGRVVADAARLGDPQAERLLDNAADALGELVGVVAGALRFDDMDVPVALSGGAFASELLRDRTTEAICRRGAHFTVATARRDPAVGAALLAFDAAGIPRPPVLHERREP